MDQEMQKYLDGVMGVVEATNFEKHCLWENNQRSPRKRTWVETGHGFLEKVGFLADNPICISLLTAVVDDHKLLFTHPTSQVVDHRVIDAWMATHLPKSAYRDGRINRIDAMNFHNIFPRLETPIPSAR